MVEEMSKFGKIADENPDILAPDMSLENCFLDFDTNEWTQFGVNVIEIPF